MVGPAGTRCRHDAREVVGAGVLCGCLRAGWLVREAERWELGRGGGLVLIHTVCRVGMGQA